MAFDSKRRVAGKINPLVMVGLVALGLVAAYWYFGHKKDADRVLDQAGKTVEKAVDQAGKELDKSAAETAEELERRNANIQSKRGFDVTK